MAAGESPPSLDVDGAQLTTAALAEPDLLRVEAAVAQVADAPGRRLTSLKAVADLLEASGPVGRIATSGLGRRGWPVRAIFFDKRADLNWALAMHQDRTIAVCKRISVPGFGPWSIKAGQPHVEPPHELTARMMTLRVHLDDVDHDNAPLLVLRASHLLGRLTERQIEQLAAAQRPTACLAGRGDVWAYRTAVVHGSTSAKVPNRRRRVLQIDYAADALPGGLEWVSVI